MKELTITIAHLPDRESPVAEIWLGEAQFAEVSCEEGNLRIEVYPNPLGKAWRFSFGEFEAAIERAKERLADMTGAVFP